MNTTPLSLAQKRHLFAVCLVSLALGLLHAFLVRAGLPYDEPAHWNNVAQYARGNFLPIMGQRGVSYEAYQAPGFYVIAALISRFTGPVSEGFAFGFLRVASLFLMMPTICLCYALARRVFLKNSHAMALLVAIFIGWNPVLLAIFASVQNDSSAIMFSLLVLFLCARRMDDAPISSTRSRNIFTARDAALLGFLVGIAILFKLTAAYLVFAVPLSLLLAQRDENSKLRVREGLPLLLIFIGAIAIVTVWWLMHNRALYGDLGGTSAMKRFFPQGAGEPVDFTNPRIWLDVSRSIVNYWWLNAEYWRNIVEAPRLAKLAVMTLTAMAFSGWILRAFSHRFAGGENDKPTRNRNVALIIAVFYGVCLLVYLRGIATQWFFPARMTLVTIVAPALFLVQGGVALLQRVRVLELRATRIYGALLAATLIFINMAMLRKATQLPPFPFDMKFSTQAFPTHSEELSRAMMSWKKDEG